MYKSVAELSREQLIELKEAYLCEHLNREPSYGELADADEIIPDEVIFDHYEGISFTDDDFWCTCNHNN